MTFARNSALSLGMVSPAVVTVGLFVLLPLLCIGIYSFWSHFPNRTINTSFTLKNWYELVEDPLYGVILWRTIVLSATTTVIAAVISYGPAYYLTTLPAKQRGFLIILLFVPSWISYVIRTMSWLHILGRNGIVNTTLMQIGAIERPLDLLYNDFAIYVGVIQYALPIMTLNIYLGLSAVDRNVIDAARTLGANGPQTFKSIVLPLSMGGLSAGCLIVFIWTLGTFVTPMLLGGPGTTYYASMVYETILHHNDFPFGSTLALLSIVFLTVSVALYGRLMGLSHLFREKR